MGLLGSWSPGGGSNPMNRVVPYLAVITVFALTEGPRLSGRALPALHAAPAAVEVTAAVHHDVSRPLRDIPSAPSARRLTERPLRVIPGEQALKPVPDGALQTSPLAVLAPTAGLNIAGIGQG